MLQPPDTGGDEVSHRAQEQGTWWRHHLQARHYGWAHAVMASLPTSPQHMRNVEVDIRIPATTTASSAGIVVTFVAPSLSDSSAFSLDSSSMVLSSFLIASHYHLFCMQKRLRLTSSIFSRHARRSTMSMNMHTGAVHSRGLRTSSITLTTVAWSLRP